MIIKGTVTNVGLPHNVDGYGNSWQWLIVETINGPITGAKGSKQELTQNFVGQQVEYEVLSKQGESGPYNQFKRVQQGYGGQGQQSYSAPQGQQTSQPAQRQPQGGQQQPQGPKQQSGDITKIRSMALSYVKDLVVAGKVELNNWYAVTCDFNAFIMTGKEPDEPGLPPNRERPDPEG